MRDIGPVPVIEDFEILDELGHGGMGTVYRARQISLGREVAIKVIRRELGLDPELLARFARETRFAALKHRAIVPVHGSGDSGGLPYLVMAYMPGGTLRDRLGERGYLTQAATAGVGMRVAEALEVAHASGVVHRDVKPSNVLFDERGDAYLGDFGVARLAAATRITRSLTVIGTTEYLAPEVGLGQPATAASDVYALGATLYECLCGRPPFTAEDPVVVMLRHRIDEVPPLPAGIDDRFRSLIRQCLEKDPLERPRAAKTVAKHLRGLRALPDVSPLGPTTFKSTSAVEHANGPVRTARPMALSGRQGSGNRRVWVALAGGLALLALGAGATVAVTRPGSGGADGGPTRVSNLTPPTSEVPSAAVEEVLTELPGYSTEALPEGDIEGIRQVLLDGGGIEEGWDLLVATRYIRDDGATSVTYVLGAPGTPLDRPVQGTCSSGPESALIELSGQPVCEQGEDPSWVLTWGDGFALRVLGTTRESGRALMAALISANS